MQSGYRGFYSAEMVKLNPRVVDNWHLRGGTALVTSRGGFDLDKIVGAIEKNAFNQVMFTETITCNIGSIFFYFISTLFRLVHQ